MKVAGRTRQHRGAIKGERLRAEKGRAGGIEHVHAHVVGVGPDAEVRIIEEVRAEVKAITIIGAGGVAVVETATHSSVIGMPPVAVANWVMIQRSAN